MHIWEYLLLFLSVIGGGGLAFVFQRSNKQMLQMVLSFGGAYILGITVIHLLPEVFSGTTEHIGLYILLGFIIQLLLEQLSVGVEHGHVHPPHQARASFAVQVMLGLCIHAFIEGLPLSSYELLHAGHDHSHNHLLLGIVLHKAPAAFALVLLFILSNFDKRITWICLFIFGIMSPLGAFIGESLQLSIDRLQIVLAIVVGSFLHIATTIIFEVDNTSHHKLSWKKMLAVFAGLGIAVGSMYI